MPRRPTVQPVETKEGDRTVLKHPAFGQITVNRISGQRTLYGSDFEHNGYVRVSIFQSELHRQLPYDAPHHRLQPLIEVDMSEAQWGSFVSSFGVGMGTQCTLNRVGDEDRPEIPYQNRARLHFDEGNEAIKASVARLETLRKKVEAGVQGLTKGRQSEMLAEVDAAISKLTSMLPFIVKSFSEEMEKTVEKAKTEVHAYTTMTIMRAGISAIQGDGPLSLPKPEDED